MAVRCEGCSTEPAIGRCISIQNSSIKVHWLQGSYSTSWKPWRLRQGRTSVDWEDEIPKSSILLYDFELTQSGHLRKRTIEHLKSAYSEINSISQ